MEESSLEDSEENEVVFGKLGIFNKKGNLYHQIDITRDSFKLGSGHLCDIKIRNNERISPLHAEIYIRNGSQPWIRRIHENDVVHVNDNPIHDTKLQHGDIIMIGDPPNGKLFKFTLSRSKRTQNTENQMVNNIRRISDGTKAGHRQDTPYPKRISGENGNNHLSRTKFNTSNKRKKIKEEPTSDDETSKKKQRIEEQHDEHSSLSILSPPLHKDRSSQEPNILTSNKTQTIVSDEPLLDEEIVAKVGDEEEKQDGNDQRSGTLVDDLAEGFDLIEKLETTHRRIKELEWQNFRNKTIVKSLENSKRRLQEQILQERETARKQDENNKKRISDLEESHNNVINRYRERELDMLTSIENLRVERNKMEVKLLEKDTELMKNQEATDSLRSKLVEMEKQVSKLQEERKEISQKKQRLENFDRVITRLQSELVQLRDESYQEYRGNIDIQENNTPQKHRESAGVQENESSMETPELSLLAKNSKQQGMTPEVHPFQSQSKNNDRKNSSTKLKQNTPQMHPPKLQTQRSNARIGTLLFSNMRPQQEKPVRHQKPRTRPSFQPPNTSSQDHMEEIEDFSSSEGSLELLLTSLHEHIEDCDPTENQTHESGIRKPPSSTKHVRFKNIDNDEGAKGKQPDQQEKSSVDGGNDNTTTSHEREEIYGGAGDKQLLEDDTDLFEFWEEESRERPHEDVQEAPRELQQGS